MLPPSRSSAPPPRAALALLALVAVLGTSAGCAEGLSNAPSINRQWTQDDFQHDGTANGPDSCPKEGQDPLAAKGQLRSDCPETPGGAKSKTPATP